LLSLSFFISVQLPKKTNLEKKTSKPKPNLKPISKTLKKKQSSIVQSVKQREENEKNGSKKMK